MSKVQVISQGTTSNYEAFTRLINRDAEVVEEKEPGALAYECFADEDTGRIVFLETYANADAFSTHVQNVTSNDGLTELLKVYEVERITVMTDNPDPRVKEIAQQFGAVQLQPLAGFVRETA